jgi:hypothetical protein
MEGCVGPRAGLDTVEKRKISVLTGNYTPIKESGIGFVSGRTWFLPVIPMTGCKRNSSYNPH